MKYLALTLLWTICATAANWTDRKEYDLVLNIRPRLASKEAGCSTSGRANTQERTRAARWNCTLQPIKRWRQPAHAQRRREMLAPSRTTGWRVLVHLLLPEEKSAYRAIGCGEKAASIACGPKPPAVSNRWPTARWLDSLATERIHAGRRGVPKVLASESTAAEISGWLGTVLATSSSRTSGCPRCGSLRALRLTRIRGTARRAAAPVRRVLERLYTSYHGNSSGLDQLRTPPPQRRFRRWVLTSNRWRPQPYASRTRTQPHQPQLLAWSACGKS